MKIALVTGATSGIGRAVSFELARRGIHVVIAARDKKAGEKEVEEIKTKTGNPNIDLLICDLSLQNSIRNAVKEFNNKYTRVSLLINCAAVFTDKRIETKEGFELMFATNHLGPFLLTNLLLDKLKSGKPSRIINVTAPSTVKPNFDDIQRQKHFNTVMAFGSTKSENLLFTYELARKLKGSGITVNAYHPGVTKNTNLMKHAPFFMRWMMQLFSPFLQTPEQAAGGLADLALSDRFDNTTGKLIHKGKQIKAPMIDDRETQEQLWEISITLTGLKK